MAQSWRLVTTLLSLPILSLTAGESTKQTQLQEISLEGVAYNATPEKRTAARANSPAKLLPEEEVIRSQPVVTPQVAPHVVDGLNAFASVDFIYWKTNIDGMEYAYGGVVDSSSSALTDANTTQGSAYNPNFKFKPGVKVGLGLNTDHDGWDLFANWTYLAGGTENSAVSIIGTGNSLRAIQPVFADIGFVFADPIVQATSAWKQNFNVIDLELGRDFFLSRYLTMRPHVGLKSAWIQETTTTKLIAPSQGDGQPISTFTLYNSEHMWGLGTRGGLDTGWHITKNWQFYGDLALTNFWGRFKKAGIETNTETGVGASANPITSLNTVETYYSVLPVIETGIGLSYTAWFSKNHYRFETRLGWEEQVWLGYNKSQDFHRIGNLSVHGLTLKTMLDF